MRHFGGVDVRADNAERSDADDVRHMPGVLVAEPFRHVPVRIRFGHRERRTSLLGKPVGTDLSRALDVDLEPIIPPDGGIALSKTLAELLHVRAGDIVELEVLEGRGQTMPVPVVEIVERFITTQAIMELDSVSRLLDEAPVISGVHFAYDEAQEESIFTAVKNMPSVAAIAIQRRALASLRQTLAENIYIMTRVYLALASVIAFGAIGLSTHSTGEYCRSLFQVLLISLMLSWLTAVTVTPLLCAMAFKPAETGDGEAADPYAGGICQVYRRFLG